MPLLPFFAIGMSIDLSYINKIKKICGNQIINPISKMPVKLNVNQTITAA
jgi:hypothetical protein